MNEYEIQEAQGWTWKTLAGMALEFLQDSIVRDEWLAHVARVAREENEYAEGQWAE